MSESGQNPNPSLVVACQLPPAADMPPHWLSTAVCHYTTSDMRLPALDCTCVNILKARYSEAIAALLLRQGATQRRRSS